MFNFYFDIYLFIAIFIALSIFALGYLVLKKKTKAWPNRLFFIFTILLSAWVIFNFLENWFDSIVLAEVFLRLDFFLGPFVIFFAALFMFNFPKSSRTANIMAAILFPVTILISYLSMGDKIIKNIELYGNKVGFELGEYFIFYAGLISFYLFTAIIYQLIQYHISSGLSKLQIRYVLFGFAISSSIIIIFNIFLQNIISVELFKIGNFSLIILVGCIFYAMARYHLMEVWVILRLSAIFTLLVASITFIFITLNHLLVKLLEINTPWDFIISSLVITIGYTPLKNLMEIITDKIFFKRHYKFTEVIGEIQAGIHSGGLDLSRTLNLVNKTITRALRVKKGAILILIPKDHFISRDIIGDDISSLKLKHDCQIINYLSSYPDKMLDREELERGENYKEINQETTQEIIGELDKIGFSLVVPIDLKDRLIGVYILGPKLSGDPYSEEDLRLLRHVAWEMSYAIDNAKSYEELKHLDEAKSKFISVVSHQLRTPIAVTRYNLEVMLDKKMPQKDRLRGGKDAYGGVLSLGRQLDQLLTALEIEDKKMVLKKLKGDLNLLISEYLKNNQALIKEKKIKLKFNPSDRISAFRFDPDKMKKVIDILFMNAQSYNPNNRIINLETSLKKFNGKNNLLFKISDNGIGINEFDKPNVFKKFFRGVEAVATAPNGFGLGLFIARKIIKAHEGDIWFESEEGKGTTFYFSLPIK